MSFTQVALFADNDVADQDKLNTIIQNQEFLNGSRVTISFNAYGVVQTDQLKIASGTIDSNNPNGRFRNRWISAGNFFTPGTRPVGQVTWGSTRNRTSTISIARRTGGTPILDHTGLSAFVRYTYDDGRNLTGPNYINWMMIGY